MNREPEISERFDINDIRMMWQIRRLGQRKYYGSWRKVLRLEAEIRERKFKGRRYRI